MVFNRRYLEVEWEVRKGNKRSFSKEVMKGSNPKVPQQNNFSDCGVYILQYVESFFEVCMPACLTVLSPVAVKYGLLELLAIKVCLV